jgi:aspartate aminotransferase
MHEMLQSIPGLITNVPKGAFYFFPDVTSYFGKSFQDRIIHNSGDLANYLLDVAHVAVVPGDAFGNPDCIRISYATSIDLLTEAMERIKRALADLR